MLRRRIVLLAAVLGVVASAVLPSPASAVVTPDIFINLNSQKALDVRAGSLLNGTPIIQWDAHGGNNQQFRRELIEGSTDTFRLVNVRSSKCVDVNNGSKLNGASIIQWTCHGGLNQRFKLQDFGDFGQRIVNVNSSKCVDIRAGSTANGASAIQWTCHGGLNQRFEVIPVA